MQFHTSTLTETKTQRTFSPYWRVIGHNDDVTTMQYVVMVLIDIFHKDPQVAFDLMMQVHEAEAATFYNGTREACELKIEMVQQHNARHGENLVVSMEPVENSE